MFYLEEGVYKYLNIYSNDNFTPLLLTQSITNENLDPLVPKPKMVLKSAIDFQVFIAVFEVLK